MLRPSAEPVHHKLCRLLYSVRDEVSRKLDRVQEEGVIEPVEVSDWIHPMVVSRKRNEKAVLSVSTYETSTCKSSPKFIHYRRQKSCMAG